MLVLHLLDYKLWSEKENRYFHSILHIYANVWKQRTYLTSRFLKRRKDSSNLNPQTENISVVGIDNNTLIHERTLLQKSKNSQKAPFLLTIQFLSQMR